VNLLSLYEISFHEIKLRFGFLL